MAIRLDELFDKTKRTFELKLIAGKGGLNHIVGWVHLLEDEIILNRFGGQELAVTTGMKSQEPDWLLHVVTSMKKRDCSGLILNTGMYLKNIPQSVIDWCTQNDFPLFAMPWEISCTQLVQEFCTIIMKRAQKEREYGDIFQSIIKKQADKIDPVRSKFGRIEKEEVSLSDKMTYVEEYSLHHGHFSFRSLLEAQSGKM